MTDWQVGDSVAFMKEMPDDYYDLTVADPPYSCFPLINDSIKEARRVTGGPCLFFMYAEDLCLLEEPPEQVLFWVKPVSTKNTSRRYSRFVEVIAAYDVTDGSLNAAMHWSNRTGIFTDGILAKQVHPWEKPVSLIERLVLNHVEEPSKILDPFAGVGTVARAATPYGHQVTSIEIDPKWTHYWPEGWKVDD